MDEIKAKKYSVYTMDRPTLKTFKHKKEFSNVRWEWLLDIMIPYPLHIVSSRQLFFKENANGSKGV